MTFLRIENLCKSYPSGNSMLHVLKGLSLRLERGDLLAVLGASGSGKSTFLHLVGGMERADSGSIAYGEMELGALDRRRLARLRNEKIGFVFQFHHLLPEFTALENVMLPLLIRKQNATRSRAVAEELLEDVGLLDRAAHRPGELSGGEQQRVAIARALAGNPEILLADEPTGNLDATTAASVHQLFQELHRRLGFTAIVVTHNPELAALCHLRKAMQDGILADAPDA